MEHIVDCIEVVAAEGVGVVGCEQAVDVAAAEGPEGVKEFPDGAGGWEGLEAAMEFVGRHLQEVEVERRGGSWMEGRRGHRSG